MRVVFTFLTDGQAYGLEIPEYFGADPQLSTAVELRGVARTIQYRPGLRVPPQLDAASSRQLARGRSASAPVAHRTAEAPVVDVVSWRVGQGVVWTHGEPSLEGADVADRLATGLTVTLGAEGLPSITLGSGVSKANPRANLHRDQIMFYALDDASVPWSIQCNLAGALAQDSERSAEQAFICTRGTQYGVTVSADGPPASAAAVREAARSAASSLTPL